MPQQLKTDLEVFAEFVESLLADGQATLSPEQVLAQWRERAETIAAVQRSMEDIEAGRVRPADEVLEELRSELPDG